jgi:ketosteroid isomerase-like protein
MPDDNLDVVQRYLERWNRGSFDVPFESVDPAVTIDWSESDAPYGGIYTGRKGWVELFSEIRNAFQDADIDVHDYVVSGPHIAVHSTARLRGRDGIAVKATSTMVWTFRGGNVIAIRLYQKHEDALAAIGAPG